MPDPIAQLRTPLLTLGFRRRTSQIYTLDLGPGVLGWLGLNKATKHQPPGRAEVNPVVGVRQDEVEHLVADLAGLRRHSFTPPTIATPIGYVIPEPRYRAWVVGAGVDDSVFAGMLSAIQKFGIGFMESHASLKAILTELKLGHGQQLEYRLPIVMCLLELRDEAGQLLLTELAKLGRRDDVAADRYRRFARAAMLNWHLQPTGGSSDD